MRRIAVQIALSFLALTVLTVGIGAVAAALLADLGGGVRRTLAENVQSVVAAERMGRALDAAEAARRGGDGTAEAAAHRALESALGQAREAAFLPEEPALLDSLGRAHATFRAGASPAGRVDALRARLLALNERAAEERAEQAASAAEAARRFLLFAVACAAVASLVAGALLARRISRPLRELTAGVAGVGPGRFAARVDDSAGGEVGALAAAFNGMAERLEAYEALNLRALVREKRTAEALVAAIPSPVVVTDGADGRVRLVNAAAERALGDSSGSGRALVGRPLSETAPALAAARADGPEPLLDLGADGEARTYRLRRTAFDVPSDPHVDDAPPASGDGARDVGASTDGPLSTSASGSLAPAGDGGAPASSAPAPAGGDGAHGHDPPGASASGADRLTVWVLDDVTPFRALDDARREFLAAVSHELRTPITSMHLAADLLLRGAAGPLTDDQRELAEIVRGDVERMRALTARLLDLARVEVGGRPHAPVELGVVARAAADGVRLQAEARGVTVAVEGGATVEGDAGGLAMAASNLVANAVRHARQALTVRVTEDAGGARLAVEDDGPGLPADATDRVFAPLVQLATGDGSGDGAASGSAGLGLAIVRRVAESHGGRAWAEPGPGGKFFVSIPPAPSTP